MIENIPTWLIVTLSIITALSLLIWRIAYCVNRDHKKHLNEISNWEVDDHLVLKRTSYEGIDFRTAEANINNPRKWPKGSVKLKKWSKEEFTYQTENGSEFFGEYKCIDYNKSSNNRIRNGKMDKFMGSLNDKAKFRQTRLDKLLNKSKGSKS